MIAGSPHPVDSEGQIVHEALVALQVRSYIVLLGLLIWTLYAIYKALLTTPAEPDATA